MESSSDQVFVRLFQLLEPNAESIEVGFQQCRFKLFKFFAWRNCEDSENLADETISRLINSVRAGQEISSETPYNYVYGIAVNVFKEYLRKKKKYPAVIDIDEVADIAVSATESDCKQQCLQQLSREKRELLERYYLDPEDREAIAQAEGLSLNALRLKIYRIKSGLKLCWENCQKDSGGNRN
jgi:RNA polymerase sigma factor (sigma-70 family)